MQEIIIDYSDCNSTAPLCTNSNATIPSGKITTHFKNTTDPSEAPQWCKEVQTVTYGNDNSKEVRTPVCKIQFQIPDRLHPPVLLYYQLSNFYQNHRRYVKSFDQDQLSGHFRSNTSISGSDCDPLQLDPDTGKAYYPCGLIANSLFNDTFSSPVLLNTIGNNDQSATYQMTNKGIAWDSDKDLYGTTHYNYSQVVPPPYWRERYPEYSDNFPFPKLHEDEAFQVWMRTAGLPFFSKLARRNDDDAMEIGRYMIEVRDCKYTNSWQNPTTRFNLTPLSLRLSGS